MTDTNNDEIYDKKITTARNAYAELVDKMVSANNKSLSKYQDAIDDGKSSVLAGINSNANAETAKLNAQQGDINSTADKSSQQAYVSKELARRNMPQQLFAMGKTGGASETAMLGLNTNFENSRNDINTARDKAIRDNILQQGQVNALAAQAKANVGSQYDTMYANAVLQNSQNNAKIRQDLALQQLQYEQELKKAQVLAQAEAEAQAKAEAEARAKIATATTKGGGSSGNKSDGDKYYNKPKLTVTKPTNGDVYNMPGYGRVSLKEIEENIKSGKFEVSINDDGSITFVYVGGNS